jgi:hypothetical protein
VDDEVLFENSYADRSIKITRTPNNIVFVCITSGSDIHTHCLVSRELKELTQALVDSYADHREG